jgi:hypothetical protein
MRDLDEAGLIRRGARGVTFRHDLCRLAVLDTIPPGGEVSLHRRMLDALETMPRADPAVLAHHALGAGDDARLHVHATAAGRAAARSGAHSQAAEFFRTAVAHIAPGRLAEEAELLELLAHESYLIDRLDDAISACVRAMELRAEVGDLAGVSRNHHELSVFEWYNANRAGAERHVAEAIAVLQPSTRHVDDTQVGHALATQAYLALQLNEVELARRHAAAAAAVAATTADEALRVRVALIEGMSGLIAHDRVARDTMLSILRPAQKQFDEIYSVG